MRFSPGKKISEMQILGFSPPLFWTAKKATQTDPDFGICSS